MNIDNSFNSDPWFKTRNLTPRLALHKYMYATIVVGENPGNEVDGTPPPQILRLYPHPRQRKLKVFFKLGPPSASPVKTKIK